MNMITTRVTLAAALAVISLKIINDLFGWHINGSSPEMTAAFTVVYEYLLRWAGVLPKPEVKD